MGGSDRIYGLEMVIGFPKVGREWGEKHPAKKKGYGDDP
jgi:hypothetical protein